MCEFSGARVFSCSTWLPPCPTSSRSRSQATVLAMTNFNPGNRYSHFDTSIDKVAGCGIAAPIASKVAATAGLFAKLGVVLVLRKFWIFIAIAAGAFITRLFRRAKPRESPASP